MRERKQREFDPTSQMLRDLIAEPGFEEESPDTQDRVHETLRLMESLGIWTDEMLRLSPRRWTGVAPGRQRATLHPFGPPPTAAPSANAERIFL